MPAFYTPGSQLLAPKTMTFDGTIATLRRLLGVPKTLELVPTIRSSWRRPGRFHRFLTPFLGVPRGLRLSFLLQVRKFEPQLLNETVSQCPTMIVGSWGAYTRVGTFNGGRAGPCNAPIAIPHIRRFWSYLDSWSHFFDHSITA